ncbi:MAG TPA: metal-dependent hydrolase [Telluria sp.]|nr:metal-dependent hydrolase [Telluria sp.]
MDNLSHTVAGLAAGELIHRLLPPEADPARQSTRRRTLLFACAAANNVPDLDLFLTSLLPRPLGYLLHHRGHTHTLLYAIPQALLLMLATLLAWPSARRLVLAGGSARTGFVLAVATGFLLHLLMDFLNSYGIHPFHPFDSRWLYGDLVYIVEPVFWVAFGVPLAMMVRRLRMRFLLLALPCVAMAYFTVRGFLLPGSLAFLVALGAAAAFAQHRAGPHGRGALAGAFCLVLAFLAVQVVALQQGRRVLAQALGERAPASRLHDIAMTAFPANPLCWTFVAVQSQETAGTFSVQRGVVSLAPALLGPGQCPAAMKGEQSDAFGPGLAVAITASDEESLSFLRSLYRSNCHINAWLRFVRAPVLGVDAAFDMRYGTGAEGNFTAIRFSDTNDRPCPEGVPGWGFPRADLLGPQ